MKVFQSLKYVVSVFGLVSARWSEDFCKMLHPLRLFKLALSWTVCKQHLFIGMCSRDQNLINRKADRDLLFWMADQ